MTKNEVCVLVPSYNEERKIRNTCEAILRHGYQLVLVDDGSTDQTLKKVEGLNLTVLSSKSNEGKGATLRRGFDWFLRQDLKAIILMDADGQHDSAELELFLKALSKETNSGVVVGNRMHNPEGMPFIRRATNRFLSWIISSLSGQSVPDSQCGYRALKRQVLEKIKLRTNRFEIESEMILAAAKEGFEISSVPISSVYRDEKSQIHPFRDTLRFFVFIFQYLCFKK